MACACTRFSGGGSLSCSRGGGQTLAWLSRRNLARGSFGVGDAFVRRGSHFIFLETSRQTFWGGSLACFAQPRGLLAQDFRSGRRTLDRHRHDDLSRHHGRKFSPKRCALDERPVARRSLSPARRFSRRGPSSYNFSRLGGKNCEASWRCGGRPPSCLLKPITKAGYHSCLPRPPWSSCPFPV